MKVIGRFVGSKALRTWASLSSRKSMMGTGILALLTCPIAGNAKTESHIIMDSYNGARVTVGCSETSIELTGVSAMHYDKTKKNNELLNHNYVLASVPLLQFQINGQTEALSSVKCTETNGVLQVSATSSDLAFSITITGSKIQTADEAVIVSTQVTYTGTDPAAFLELTLFPNLQVTLPKGAVATAMLPHTIGGVLPVAKVNGRLGQPLFTLPRSNQPLFGLPNDLNVMEIAEVYDGGPKNSGGVFFSDVNGDYRANIAPMQFVLCAGSKSCAVSDSQFAQISGYWTALLKPKQQVALPDVAIGAHASGDWRSAADYYVFAHQANFFPTTPQWFREAAGIYMLGNAGGGSFLSTFPTTPIDDHYLGIALFQCGVTVGTKSTGTVLPNTPGHRCLEDVFADAQKLGSNVIYLTGWWQGGYKNKGDYIVDPDLGGATGLQAAVKDLHDKHKGSKVILYMESYVVDASSTLASSGLADTWHGTLSLPYPAAPADGPLPCFGDTSTCMAIPNTQWQDYLINRASDLINATGVDGFFLDSLGSRMNYPVFTTSEDVNYSSQQWSAATLRFVDRLRAMIQTVPGPKSDRIVMGEISTGQFPLHWDGGSAADLSQWNEQFPQDGGILRGAPIRYASPYANFFVNGSGVAGSGPPNPTALSSVNQVFAAGYNLALGPFFLLDVMQVGTATGSTDTDSTPHFDSKNMPPFDPTVQGYIQSLMEIRKSASHKDALIDGSQTPVPTNGSSNVLAYVYTGSNSQVLTVVNNTDPVKSPGPLKSLVTVKTPCVTVKKSDHQKPESLSWQSVSIPGLSVKSTNLGCDSVTIEDFSPAPTKSGDNLGGLAIFARACGSACTTVQTASPTPAVPLMNESFLYPPYGTALSNWTDWNVSGGAASASGRWSTETQTTVSGLETSLAALLKVQSIGENSLLFYDSFAGGDFTYTGGVTFDSFGSESTGFVGSAGLSFRLSDNLPTLDAGNQGYDVVLTNVMLPSGKGPSPAGKGYLQLLKRSSGIPQSLPGCSQAVSLTAGQTYQLSVTAVTDWKPSTTDPSNNYPRYPVSTAFTVSIDGAEPLTCTDSSVPYFSGRFGVNASNVDAHFTCLQANGPAASDGPMPPACAPIVIERRPPPGQKTPAPDSQGLLH